MKCRYCGSTINSDSRFCQYCGHTVIQNENLAKLMEPVEMQESVEENVQEQVQEQAQKQVQEQVQEQALEYVKEQNIPQYHEEKHYKEKHQKENHQNNYHKPINKKRRFSRQHVRSLIMLSLIVVAIACGILLPFITPEKSKAIIDTLWTNNFWKVMNIVMLTIPQMFITLLGQLGWLLILFVCLAGIGVSLLTMIRTTRTKKMISLGIIAAYVVILIITLIIFETKVK